MKEKIIKIIVFVIIPIIILLGISIYLVTQNPSIKFGLAKRVTDYAFDRSVKQGNIKPEYAIQLKKASYRLLELGKIIEVNKLDKKKIDAKIIQFTVSKEFTQYRNLSSNKKLSDEEAKKLVKMMNKMADIMEKAIEEQMINIEQNQ